MQLVRVALISLCLMACGRAETSSFLSAGPESSKKYPQNPNEAVTPGTTCSHPDSYRYKEKVPYCNRDVDSSLKKEIIREYDQKFGYQIQTFPRSQFKIDHYIPLCMGGGNDQENLWPQHRSVYELTDAIEQKLCQLMTNNLMMQKEAIGVIRNVKNHLDQARSVENELNDRLGKDLLDEAELQGLDVSDLREQFSAQN